MDTYLGGCGIQWNIFIGERLLVDHNRMTPSREPEAKKLPEGCVHVCVCVCVCVGVCQLFNKILLLQNTEVFRQTLNEKMLGCDETQTCWSDVITMSSQERVSHWRCW